MPGGEGSSINLLDHHHRASTTATTSATDECANGDDVRTGTSTGATFTSTMTSALAGDGLRRRKVIHAARETLDKGKSKLILESPYFYGVIAGSLLTKPRATAAVVAGTKCPSAPSILRPHVRISGDRSSFPNMIPPAAR